MWFTCLLSVLVAATAALLMLYSDGKMVLWHTEELCSLHEASVSVKDRSVHPCVVFSDTYEQSSLKFQESVKMLQRSYPDTELHRLPVLSTKENIYSMDVAVIPGTAPGLVIHTAGTHGVEGYAGAAIQLTWMQFLLESSILRPTVVLVHAVNPYGMKHYRRANENNVDLNRNGIHESKQEDVWESLRDHHFNRDNYDRFAASLFHLRGPPVPWYSLFVFFVKGIWAITQYGILHLKTAMVAAQYHAPHGIFYGGQQTEASLRLLREFLQHRFANTHQAVTWIDVHTGLGPMGVDTLLVKRADAAAQLDEWFPGAQHPFASSGAEVARGYENVRGLLHDYFEPLFEHAWVVTQEFGTLPTILVGMALVLENAAFQNLPETEALEWARRTTKRAFYPQSMAWRQSVIRRGITVLEQAMERSMVLSKAMGQEKERKVEDTQTLYSPEQSESVVSEEMKE